MTMKCKYCDAEMADWGGFCPVCGKSNAEETEMTQMPEVASEEEENVVLMDAEADQEEAYEPSAKLKKSKRIAAMSGCIALLAVLATVLFFGIRSEGDVGKWFDWLKPKANDIYCKDSFTVEDKKAVKKGDVVVANMDGIELTNTQLQFYYWSAVYDFLNNNYYYLSYLGFDYSQPLDQQVCYFDKSMTWQQYFLQSALDTWQSNMAFATLAKENNFQMSEEYRTTLDNIASELESTASKNGYESADALIQESFGPGVTVQDYIQYMEDTYLSYLYFAELYEAAQPTMEELEAYFMANQEALEKEGIKQDGSYTVDVRHILVHIDVIAKEMEQESEGTADAQAEEDEETEEKYTEAQWEACRKAAQEILDEYLAGELTEERFAELAKKYSDDNADEGGLYTQVTEGQMVETFNDWCFDPARLEGDTGLVKTEFGYHIMYFVDSEEVWLTKTRSAYLSEKSNEIVTEALERFTVEVKYKKIVLGDVTL